MLQEVDIKIFTPHAGTASGTPLASDFCVYSEEKPVQVWKPACPVHSDSDRLHRCSGGCCV